MGSIGGGGGIVAEGSSMKWFRSWMNHLMTNVTTNRAESLWWKISLWGVIKINKPEWFMGELQGCSGRLFKRLQWITWAAERQKKRTWTLCFPSMNMTTLIHIYSVFLRSSDCSGAAQLWYLSMMQPFVCVVYYLTIRVLWESILTGLLVSLLHVCPWGTWPVTSAAETRDLCSHMPFRRISGVHSPEYSIWHQQQAGRMLPASDYLLTFS